MRAFVIKPAKKTKIKEKNFQIGKKLQEKKQHLANFCAHMPILFYPFCKPQGHQAAIFRISYYVAYALSYACSHFKGNA